MMGTNPQDVAPGKSKVSLSWLEVSKSSYERRWGACGCHCMSIHQKVAADRLAAISVKICPGHDCPLPSVSTSWPAVLPIFQM